MLEFSTQEKRFILFLFFTFIIGESVAYYRQISAADSLRGWRQQNELIRGFKTQREKLSEKKEAKAVLPDPGQQLLKAKLIAKLDLNSANIEELQTLDRIGPVLAKKIVLYRDQNGAFNSVDDLLRINGVGPKTLARIRDHVCIRP